MNLDRLRELQKEMVEAGEEYRQFCSDNSRPETDDEINDNQYVPQFGGMIEGEGNRMRILELTAENWAEMKRLRENMEKTRITFNEEVELYQLKNLADESCLGIYECVAYQNYGSRACLNCKYKDTKHEA